MYKSVFLNDKQIGDDEDLHGYNDEEENDEDETVAYSGAVLDLSFNEFPLKFYLKHSTHLANIFQKVDLLAVEIDINIVNSLCEVFELNKDYYQILGFRNLAKNLGNFLFNLIIFHLESTSTNMTLIELTNKLWETNHMRRICRDIYCKQANILNEFRSKKAKNKILIGLVYHCNANTELICKFNSILLSHDFEILDLTALPNEQIKSSLKKVYLVFVLFDEHLDLSFDETNQIDDKYKLIGRLMYKEYLKLDRNYRFHLILLDNYASSSLKQFKYVWLLRELEHENLKQKYFQKPIRFDLDKLDQIYFYLDDIKKSQSNSTNNTSCNNH